MPHFTYSEPINRNLLYQGDIIKRTEDIETILKEVHPHFYKKPDYKFFMVLTQSCDLKIRENNKCSARYITIAAIRPFQLAVEREVSKFQYDPIEEKLGICELSRQAKLEQFIERLLNNNEENYFFLYREPLIGLEEDYCAFLQLSIPLKADPHYKILLGGKILQLKDSFQHKLGYLVGKLYSRVGTEDWLPDYATKEKFRGLIKDPINKIDSITWLEKTIHQYILKNFKQLPEDEQTVEKLEELIKQKVQDREKKREEVLNGIAQVLTDLAIDATIIENATRRIGNRSEFRANVK